jgi:hypothetical protein
MTFSPARCACAALLGLAASAPCLADSLVSSASSAGSASVGSLSDSLHGSSNSSSRDDKNVSEGDYRIVEVALLGERAGMRRLKLQPVAPQGEAGEIALDVLQKALGEPALAPGDVVAARHRAYGLEFARGEPREAFFLVLADDWLRELEPHAVTR